VVLGDETSTTPQMSLCRGHAQSCRGAKDARRTARCSSLAHAKSCHWTKSTLLSMRLNAECRRDSSPLAQGPEWFDQSLIARQPNLESRLRQWLVSRGFLTPL